MIYGQPSFGGFLRNDWLILVPKTPSHRKHKSQQSAAPAGEGLKYENVGTTQTGYRQGRHPPRDFARRPGDARQIWIGDQKQERRGAAGEGLTRIFHRPTAPIPPALINTPLQRGVGDGGGVETVSTVSTGCGKPLKRFSQHPAPFTPLKRGVNERGYEICGLRDRVMWI